MKIDLSRVFEIAGNCQDQKDRILIEHIIEIVYREAEVLVLRYNDYILDTIRKLQLGRIQDIAYCAKGKNEIVEKINSDDVTKYEKLIKELEPHLIKSLERSY